MEIYDTIIIGGGISGLYLNYKLLKQKKSKSTLLIEKANKLGGRVFTYKTNIRGKQYQMEAGAGRFSENHKTLLKLIKEFKLEKYMYEIGGRAKLILTKKKWKEHPLSNYSPYQLLDELFKNVKPNNIHRNINFKKFLLNNYNKDICDYLYDTYPYVDIFKMNLFDVIQIYKTDFNEKNKFYILKCGFQKIIDILKQKILKMGGKIKINTEFTNYKIIDKKFIVKTNKCNYFSNSLVLALPKSSLIHIPNLKKVSEIKSVGNSKLLRIYAVFDTKKCSWFKNIPKVITDSKISYFIPIDYKKGLVMISYTDEENTNYLLNLKKKYGEKKMMDYILNECKKIFNIDVPKPIWFKLFYWKSGVGHWLPGYSSKNVAKSILKPIPYKKLFICGENYSEKYQGWIEGSLRTADKIVKII